MTFISQLYIFWLFAEGGLSMGITAPPSLAPCGIPPFLGHKKATIIVALYYRLNQLIQLFT